jgi:hypothetical protein
MQAVQAVSERSAEAKAVREWAGHRRCQRCDLNAVSHVIAEVEGRYGTRVGLVRNDNGHIHEFDPGERRRDAR